MAEKLLTFKEWIKKVYSMNHLELLTKHITFQQMVHQHYTSYVEAWESEQDEN